MASAPNPNAGLNSFVVSDLVTSGKVFDAASWATRRTGERLLGLAPPGPRPPGPRRPGTQASWASASWTSASWASASWARALLELGLVGERLVGLGFLVGQRRGRGAVRRGRVSDRRRARRVRSRPRARGHLHAAPIRSTRRRRRCRDARTVRPGPRDGRGSPFRGNLQTGSGRPSNGGRCPFRQRRTLQLWLCGPARSRGTERHDGARRPLG